MEKSSRSIIYKYSYMNVAEKSDSHKYKGTIKRGYNMFKLDYNLFDIKIKYTTLKDHFSSNRQIFHFWMSFIIILLQRFFFSAHQPNNNRKKGFSQVQNIKKKPTHFCTIDIAAGVREENMLGGDRKGGNYAQYNKHNARKLPTSNHHHVLKGVFITTQCHSQWQKHILGTFVSAFLYIK